MMLTGLVILACALAAVAYLLIRRMGVDEERERHETRVMRDIPHRQAVPEFEHSSGARFETLAHFLTPGVAVQQQAGAAGLDAGRSASAHWA